MLLSTRASRSWCVSQWRESRTCKRKYHLLTDGRDPLMSTHDCSSCQIWGNDDPFISGESILNQLVETRNILALDFVPQEIIELMALFAPCSETYPNIR
eukprot:UN00948